MLAIAQAFAQVKKADLLFYRISEKDGLADNQVNCFYQDYRGIMWMGSHYGLNSFDGSIVNTWQASTQPGNEPLLSNDINGITADARHVMWIVTSSGLSSFNPATKKIHSWQSKFDNNMHALACDGNLIWIATGFGLLQFNTITKTFSHFENTSAGQVVYLKHLNNDLNSLLLDSKKRLWLCAVNGVWLFDVIKHTFVQYDGQQNDRQFDGMVNTMFEDHEGKLWTGTWSKGLKQIVPESHTVINYSTVKDMPFHIMSMAEQKDGAGRYKFWLSAALTEFNQETQSFQSHDLKPIAEAASLDPRCLYVSRDNLLWISTVKGVYILDPSRQLFKHYFITRRGNITDQAPALFAHNNQLWVGGGPNFSLKLFDDDFNVVKDYTKDIAKVEDKLHDLTINTVKPDGKDGLLLSTANGVLKVDPRNDKVSRVGTNLTNPKNAGNFINNAYVANNKIWCFPWRRGVWQFDQKTNKFNPLLVKLPDAYGIPKNLNLADVAHDDIGNTWIADLDYGLVKYTAKTKKFERFVDDFITPYSRVICVTYLKKRLWLISNTTVVAVDPGNNTSQGWPLPAGMNKTVHDYAFDDNGNLWIATRTGLVIFNTINHTFNRYTEEDGLINNDMDGTLRKMSSGMMVYAAENYLTSFKPTELLRVPAKKSLILTAAIAGDSDMLCTSRKTITIPAASGKLLFTWALINYTNPLQNRYYAKLGTDKEWNYVGNKGQIEYNGLPPGAYKFQYRAVTADGLASAEKMVVFTVEPFFWQAWWFRSIVILLLIISVMLIIVNVRMREQKKAALRVQLSELEMKALRAQMNPHFIFNALNSIQECIITQNTSAAYTYLSNFSKLVRMILENSEKQFIDLADELETLRLYLMLEKLRFDDTFDFQINTGPDVDTSFVRIPSMIVQPFVENALWHGLIHKKGVKTLQISFERDNNDLMCIIEDNGIGRAQSENMKAGGTIKKQSMGMKITTERLELLEAETVVNVDDLFDNSGTPSGTKVTLIIPLKY